MTQRRIPTVDIVRGVLMVGIICTHALGNEDPRERWAGVVGTLCAVLGGTVGFATISGALIGYFLVTRADRLQRVFRSYFTRAILLVLIAHPLISLALFGPDGHSAPFLHFMTHTLFITDDLAVIFLVLVPLMPRLTPRVRLGMGVMLMVIARFVLMTPAPHAASLLLTRELLAGVDSPGPSILISNYPLLSIAGMFLIGSWIGHEFAAAERTGRLDALARKLWSMGIWLLGAGAAMGAVWAVCKFHVGGIDAPSLRKFFYPDYSFSGYPAYLAGTLFLMALFISRLAAGRVAQFFRIFGRASLFTYVVHYFLVQTLPWLLHWQYHMRLWQLVVYLAVTIPLLYVAARWYNRVTKPAPAAPPLPSSPASA